MAENGSIGELAYSVLTSLLASEGLMNQFFMLALGYCVVKVFFANLKRIEKLINEQGFVCTQAEHGTVKRILARYFGVSQTDAVIGGIDGEVGAWLIPD